MSPQQILDAGHRAEAEGAPEVAVQFYRHLADNYGHTAEASEARNGLGRLGSAGAHQELWHYGSAHQAASEAPAPRLRNNARRARSPAPRNYYRTGRAIAVLLSAIGWLMTAVGLATPLLYYFYYFPPMAPGSYGFLGLLGGAAGTLLIGLLIVAVGQAARALFDQANATRELVAIERTRLSAV